MAAREKINVVRLSSVHYQHPDLNKAAKFLEDFGLVEVERDASRIFFAGFGIDPYVYVAEQSPTSQRKFLGGAWVVESPTDLEIAAAHPQAVSQIVDNDAPGGGRKVTITDPNGFPITFVHGQQLREMKPEAQVNLSKTSGENELTQNSAFEKPREGTVRRFTAGPSPVHKLGHYGFLVPQSVYKSTLEWYTSLFNIKLTDAVFSPATGEDTTCFMHIDRGMAYTDHHSFFLGVSAPGMSAHVHHSSFEVNDFDTEMLGHDYLLSRSWTNCWGIGRHVLGSQIFDYWFDASGNIVEHYSDGDLVNEQTPLGRELEAPNSLYIWGPNIPLGFITGKVEDAGKSLPPPPPQPLVDAPMEAAA